MLYSTSPAGDETDVLGVVGVVGELTGGGGGGELTDGGGGGGSNDADTADIPPLP